MGGSCTCQVSPDCPSHGAKAPTGTWSRRRDAPAPGVGYCTCKPNPDCPTHGEKK